MNNSRVRMSVVVPVFNERDGILKFAADLQSQLNTLDVDYDVVFVDDGSSDGSWDLLTGLQQQDARLRSLRFTRNFGKEAALLAGLSASTGDVVVTIDSDGQHPPASISEMLDHWRQGAKVVHGIKAPGSYTSGFARWRAKLFNRALSRLSDINMERASDFKLLDRAAVNVLVKSMPEHRRFYRGLTSWMGYPTANVAFRVRDRQLGASHWTSLQLVRMAGMAIISFTSAPLRIISVLGVITLAFGFVVGLDALVSWMRGESVSGFATLIISLLIIGSFIMISLGIVGEYIAKIYDEIKDRPVFIVDSRSGFDTPQDANQDDSDTTS